MLRASIKEISKNLMEISSKNSIKVSSKSEQRFSTKDKFYHQSNKFCNFTRLAITYSSGVQFIQLSVPGITQNDRMQRRLLLEFVSSLQASSVPVSKKSKSVKRVLTEEWDLLNVWKNSLKGAQIYILFRPQTPSVKIVLIFSVEEILQKM